MELDQTNLNDDENSYERLFEQLYKDKQLRESLEKLKNRYRYTQEEAFEILQVCMIKLFHSIQSNSFRGDSSIKTYFLRICRNYILNQIRKKNPIQYQEIIKDHQIDGHSLSVSSIEKEEERQEEERMRKELRSLIDQMTKQCKKIFTSFLDFVQPGMLKVSMATLAEKVELKNAQQANKLFYRCRKKFRAAVKNDEQLKNILKLT
jgi:RNA polymerase sigma factor (sigma-70 family)